MAIWQFELALHPNATGSDRPPEGDGRPEAGPMPLFRRADADLVGAIDAILPRRDSWSEDLLLWGEEGGDRIHAVLEGGRIAEVTARVDLRRPPGRFVEQILELARSCDAHFRTADDREVPADKARMLEAVRHSEAYRFVDDPRRFFDGVPSDR